MFFWKMNGTGNDFIIINNIKEKVPFEKFPAIAQKLCERHLSIGADGIMVVEKPESDAADIKAHIFNADGSEAEMCGNGIRCIARYVWEEKLGGNPVKIDAKAGYVEVERLSKREYKVKLQNASVVKSGGTADINGWEYLYTYLELGNPGIPHIVVPMPPLIKTDRDALRTIARQLRYYKDFPKGANVNFYEQISADTVELITYERGVEDFTYACGTGSGSTALALYMQKIVTSNRVNLKVPGGLLKVELAPCEATVQTGDDTYNIYLIGDTNIICKAEVLDEDLVLG
ncbi:MAG: diaminopimelate epimerase [Treponema sp.]|jgi:diaminopimelate epimerase|nr:diaminopimelate epimerase [Treponema sp.]